jgi:hypothetical protein
MALKGKWSKFGTDFNEAYVRVEFFKMVGKTTWHMAAKVYSRKPEDGESFDSIDQTGGTVPVDLDSPLNPIAQAYDWLKTEGGLSDFEDC